MCMVLYLATDAHLETTEFSREAPAFYVGALSAHEGAVRERVEAPQVYYLGSQTACGCGFEYGSLDADVYPEGADSRRQLVALLRSLLDAGHTAEIYACWSGDEAEPATHHRRVQPNALLDPASLDERHHLVVTDAP